MVLNWIDFMSLFSRVFNKIHHFVLGLNRESKRKIFFESDIHKDFKKFEKYDSKKILVIGIYLTDYPNLANHLMKQFSNSQIHLVDQKWVAIGENSVPIELSQNTILHLKEKTPKFKLLNKILSDIDLELYDYIIFTDDDIAIHDSFIDVYVHIVDKYELKIAQPARTRHSFNIHKIVLQKDNSIARVTNFVEIGPIFSFHSSIFKNVLPFPEDAEMGWGLDYVWPKIAEKNSFKIGIVDLISADHSYRPQSKTYSNSSNMILMNKFLNKYENNKDERKINVTKCLFK